MKMSRVIYGLILAVSLLCGAHDSAQARGLYANVDSSYRCVAYKEAGLHVFRNSKKVFSPVLKTLNNIITKNRGRINIWHVGGSHVQAGIFSHRVRRNFANNVNSGVASRTLLFPFKLAGTNGPSDYRTSSTGSWSKAKCLEQSPSYRLGMSGFTAVTSSPGASITFSLSTSDGIDWSTSLVTVLGSSNGSAVPYIVIGQRGADGEEGTERIIEASQGDDSNGFYFEMPYPVTEFTVKFHGLGGGNRFEFRGAIAMNGLAGVSYFASGVNGAATSSWLRCSLLEQDLKAARPDVVIFGIGINDAHTPNFNRSRFKNHYQELVDRIKSVNPNCFFIFVTNNDCFLRGNVNPNTRNVEKVFIELALDNNGAVWDQYRVMGGYGGSKKWVSAGLMQSDHIHLTRAGYQLVGDLLYNSIIGEYYKWCEQVRQN